jgi:soluble cytochrome b562
MPRRFGLVALVLVLASGLSCYRRPPEVEQALARNSASQAVQPESTSPPLRAKETARSAGQPANRQLHGQGQHRQPPTTGPGATARATRTTTKASPSSDSPKEPALPAPDQVAPLPIPQQTAAQPEDTATQTAPEESTAKRKPTGNDGQRSLDWGQYASAEELRAEIDYTLQRIEANLRDRQQFARFHQDVAADGTLLSVLGAVLWHHPQGAAYRTAAQKLIEAGLDLAAAASGRSLQHLQEAQEALQKARQALSRKSPGGVNPSADVPGSLDWSEVAELDAIMKRLDVAFKRVRTGVSSRQFEKDAELIGREARVLAILARVAEFSRPSEPAFQELAVRLATSAMEAAEAAQQKNVDLGRKAVTAINETCNRCHQVYRLDRGTTEFDF